MASGKRLDDELFDDYRKRLREEEAATKKRLKGTTAWVGAFRGTYRKGESKI